MTQPDPLTLSVGKLLTLVSAQSTDHLTKVDTDLTQTSLLITEAIDKLAASFLAIHAAVTAQQAIIDSVLGDVFSHPAERTALDTLRAEIGAHANAAITNLQFQDMTSQLIDRSRNRVQGLHETLTVLGTNAAHIINEDNQASLVTQLDQIRESVSKHSTKLDGSLRKAVNQTHLESGDIELF